MEDKEDLVEGLLQVRLEEVLRRLLIIQELRWKLGDMYCGTSEEDKEKYFDANEFLNETEKRTWAYGRGEIDDL
jgi:hypothetical protein